MFTENVVICFNFTETPTTAKTKVKGRAGTVREGTATTSV